MTQPNISPISKSPSSSAGSSSLTGASVVAPPATAAAAGAGPPAEGVNKVLMFYPDKDLANKLGQNFSILTPEAVNKLEILAPVTS